MRIRTRVCVRACVYVCVYARARNRVSKMGNGNTNVRGGCFFNYKLAERDGGSRDMRFRIFRFLFFVLTFFTYSEALPALRLRRDDIFGPPVGSALNNP